MFTFIVGFAIGVVAGPAFLAKVWPRVVAWYQSH